MDFPILLFPLVFIFGLVIGSFLNVLIVRLPAERDLITPSHCPECLHPIKWHDNVPLFSYILLRGKCRHCRKAIPPTYPLIELSTGIGACLLVPETLDHIKLFHSTVLFSTLCVFLCHFIIDLRHKILPDHLNGYLGFIFILNGILFSHWKFYLVGGLVGLAMPYSIALTFKLIRGKIGLGGGDIKLYGVLGIHLGPLGVLQNIFLSSLIGSLLAGLLIMLGKVDKNDYIPFGPFIIVIAAWQVFFPATFQQYLSLSVP